ncbi:MAG: hypothetical protein WCG36_00210 [bacterium]
MNTPHTILVTGGRRSGAILVVSLLVCFTAAVLVAAYVSYATNSSFQTRRAIDYRKARAAADASLEYATLKLAEVLGNQSMFPCRTNEVQILINSNIVNNFLTVFTNSIDGYALSRANGLPALSIHVDSDVQNGIIANGSFGTNANIVGANGDFQFFTITAGARNPESGVTAVLQKRVQLLGIYLIRFGVFYESDLEIQPGPTMTFYGAVHCNSDMYLGGPLFFYDRVSSHLKIFSKRKDDGTRNSIVNIQNQSGVNVPMKQGANYVDSDYSLWMGSALTLWNGRVLSGVHGVPILRPPINVVDDPYSIIQRPTTTNLTLANQFPYYSYTTNNINQDTEDEKMANKACLRILVSNDTVYAWDYANHLVSTNSCFTNVILSATTNNYSGTYRPGFAKTNMDTYIITTNTTGFYDLGTSYAKIGTNAPFVYTNSFYDAREQTNVTPFDIYVDRLANVITGLFYDVNSDSLSGVTTNTPWRTNVVFVTFVTNRVFGARMPAVRLRNAEKINLSRGLTVVSDQPIYIEGNFNTTNRFSTNNLPTMVAGDAVTMLSTNWQDALSSNSACSGRTAGNTTYDTVIMTGNTLTTTGHYNGGLENVLRFLEDWNGKTVTYRGSIIDLWTSRIAKDPWQSPSTSTYYNAPTRNWGYDTVFRYSAPPGMPRVYGMEELDWQVITWDQAGW